MNNEYQGEASDENPAGGKIPVLVCIEPGFLRDSLLTILQSFRFISILEGTPQEQPALPEACPAPAELLLIDCSPNHPGWGETLGEVRAKNPHCKCLAIADTFRASRAALETGADAVISTGFTSQELELVVRQLARFESKDTRPAAERKNGQATPAAQSGAGTETKWDR